MYRKQIIATILVVTALTSLFACGDDNRVTPAETILSTTEEAVITEETTVIATETTTVPEAETTAITEKIAYSTETTAAETLSPEESKAIFDYYAKDYPIVKLAYSEFESFFDTLPKDRENGYTIIEATDVPGLFLWISNYSFSTEKYHTSYVFCNGDADVNSLDFVFDDDRRFVLLNTDELTVFGVNGSETEYYIYNSSTYHHIYPNSGRDGSIIDLYVENGVLCYRMENPIITKGKNDPSIILENVLTPQTWKEEWGTVDRDFNFIKKGESTVMQDGFLASLLPYNGIETVSEIFEKNRAKYDIDIPGINLLPEHRDLPTYKVNLDMSVPGYKPTNSNHSAHIEDYVNNVYSNTGYFPQKYAVSFPDDPELAMIFETSIYHGSSPFTPSIRSQLKFIYFNGAKLDTGDLRIGCGFAFRLYHTDDVIAIIGGSPNAQGQKVFLSKNGVYDLSIEHATDLSFAYSISVTDDGIMNVIMVPTQIAFAQHSGWCLEYESDDIYMIEAVVSVTDEGITLIEKSRMTLGEFYESDLPGYWNSSFWKRTDSGVTTFDEYKEQILAQLENTLQ